MTLGHWDSVITTCQLFNIIAWVWIVEQQEGCWEHYSLFGHQCSKCLLQIFDFCSTFIKSVNVFPVPCWKGSLLLADEAIILESITEATNLYKWLSCSLLRPTAETDWGSAGAGAWFHLGLSTRTAGVAFCLCMLLQMKIEIN